NPDGDGFCASLALQRLLLRLGYASSIIVDEGNLDRFAFLMQESTIELYRPEHRFDMVIVLDCNSGGRLGMRQALLDTAKTIILLDHHERENGVIPAQFSYIDPSYVSVGAILFDLFKEDIRGLKEEDRKHIGACLYTTILNDTNNFTNANVNPEVFRVAGEINALGIAVHLIYKEYFQNHSPYEMRYVGEVLSTIELHLDDRILFMHSSLEMLERNALCSEEVLSLTRWVQGVKGLDVIVYFREEAPELFKLSLRSLKLDVNLIAMSFGGGGHKNAAGCHLSGSLDSIKAQIKELLVNSLQIHTANHG
ncbi:MAG: DHH family phosphoesterase, partial [Candidatus Cloacimonadaceae bacterium]|nr:DHH family phosphoesterase [Candidatus Cloacimonadaceae bacterium]